MNKRQVNSKGMTIVEILVSVVIISLVMGVLFTLLLQLQKINSESSKKSTILISRNVITKAIEKDMIEIGVKAISSCTYSEFNLNHLIDEDEPYYDCVKIEYNQSYDISDLGYILIYKQSSDISNPSWVMKYGRGYYDNCVSGNVPVYENWKETYSVVQKLDENIALKLNPMGNKLTYTSSFESGKKYSEQKLNSGNLYIQIMDEAGYKYDIDLSFSFKLNYPSVPSISNEERNFTCAEDDNSLSCFCENGVCDKTESNSYIYKCSETKAKLGSVVGMNKNFINVSNVNKVGIYSSNVRTVTFYNEDDNTLNKDLFPPPIDISYSQNGTVKLYYAKDSKENIYDLNIVQSGGVTVYGSSLASMFSDFTMLKSVNFGGFNSSGITNMNSMFYNCPELTTLINFEKLDFSNVEDVSLMFYRTTMIKRSPFKGINLESVLYANSVFNMSGISNDFNYATDFNAKNVKTMRNFLKSSKIFTFTLDYGGETMPNLVNTSNILTNCSYLTDVTLSNTVLPSFTSMDYTFDNSKKLVRVIIKDFITPNLNSMMNVFYNCTSLEKVTFENFNTTNVTSWVYAFYYTALGNFDMSMLSFENATTFQYMFGYSSIKTLKLNADDETNDERFDSLKNLSDMFYHSPNFEGFTGKKPKFRGATTVEGMFSYAGNNLEKLVDFSNLELNNCTNFQQMFYYSYYPAIDLSGIHSKVKDEIINMNKFMCNSTKLHYFFLCDAEFQTGVNLLAAFQKCYTLTFVAGLNYSSDESLANYFAGITPYAQKDGRYPFDRFMIDTGYATSLNYAFESDGYLRGMPDGFLDGILCNENTTFISLFNYAFTEVIPNSINISEEDYFKTYEVVIPFRLSSTTIMHGAIFYHTYNLASIRFKNPGEIRSTRPYHPEQSSLVKNFGNNAYGNHRVNSLRLYLDDMTICHSHSSSGLNKCSFTNGIEYAFSEFGANYKSYNEYTRFVRDGIEGVPLEIHLSDDCDIAKYQYKNGNSRFQSVSMNKVTYYGPDGCDYTS